MERKMKALWKTEPKAGAELKEADIPKPKENEVLIKVKACGVCGTDKHIYNWDKWSESRIKPPMIFGHEFSGEVIEKGNKTEKVELGDFVSGETHLADFTCFQCRIGNAHICENLKILGVDVNGSFAEYLTLPWQNAIINDKKISHETSSVQEPFGNAVHTVFAQETKGKTVSVFGCGPIGLYAVMILKKIGAERIFAVDVNDFRLNIAEKLGAEVIDAKKEKSDEVILKETCRGADVFLEMSGHPDSLKKGFNALRGGGEAAILGVFPDEVKLDVNNGITFKSAVVRGINGRRMFETWDKVKELQKQGIDLSKIITHKFKLEEFEKGFDLINTGNCGKIVLIP